MNIAIVILLLLVGVGLLVAELFLLPGFGLAGICGFAGLAGSVVYAYCRVSPMAGHITLAAAVVLTALAIYGFVRGRALEKMALDTTIDSKVEMPKAGKHMEEMGK